ncbi:hypothetical protein jaqu_24240 [Jannaschia aquimarina]|uniref:Uncharacterized protein n=1 Tax=Jannaschia aquimarina TaxID=935700 RepID=A0A0D1EDT8_9RHOB|nr:hypothetical protein jaqu_24240 [Jannaschia aquimarina]SNT09874.1 hypothetical protein SAMN05421775_105240 [Jannaschia aquimarina]
MKTTGVQKVAFVALAVLIALAGAGVLDGGAL